MMFGSNLKTLFSNIIVISLFVLSACSSTFNGTSKIDSKEINGYKLRPGDVIEVKFDYYPDFNQTVIVHPDGTVSLRALGELKVIDLTPEILKNLLNEKYSDLLAEPKIEIEVLESSNFKVYIGGDLKHPGIVKFRGNLSIVQGILLAGGLEDGSTDYKIIIFRNRGAGGMKTYKFELNKHGERDKALKDFRLAPYDIVFVLKSSEIIKDKGNLI
ncbi:MAG: polysaccharide biosynthesis/export family protein [bacterium]